MNKKDKEVLLKEIEKIKSKHSLILDQSKPNLIFEGKYYNNIHRYNSTYPKEVPLLKKLNNKKMSRKVLINNEYGLLSNLLYKYREKLDDEILINLFFADVNLNFFLDARQIFNASPKNVRDLIFKDKGYMLEVLRICFYNRGREIYFNNIPNLLENILSNKNELECVCSELRNDKEFMLEIIKLNVLFFKEIIKYDTKELYKYFYTNKLLDSETLEKINQYSYGLEYASDEMKNDKEFMLQIIKLKSNLLKYASDEIKDNKEVVIKALKKDKDTWEYISDRLKKDKDIIMILIKRWKISLEDLYIKYKFNSMLDAWVYEDIDIVLAAIKNNHTNIYYVSDKLFSDKNFILKLIKLSGYYLKYASSNLKNDKEVILEVIKQDGYYLKYASDRLKKNKNIVLSAIKNNIDALNFIDDDLLFDKDILKIIEQKKEDNNLKKINEVIDRYLSKLYSLEIDNFIQ